jgi:hypothetical protein
MQQRVPFPMWKFQSLLISTPDEHDRYELPITKMMYSFSENDCRLMRQTLETTGGRRIHMESGTGHLLDGCHMGAANACRIGGRIVELAAPGELDISVAKTLLNIPPHLAFPPLTEK